MFASIYKFVSTLLLLNLNIHPVFLNHCLLCQLSCSWQVGEEEKVEEVYGDGQMQDLSA